MRSFEAIAMNAPQRIETTAMDMISGAPSWDAFGKIGRHREIIPKTPSLSSTPTSRADVPGGACSAVSGSQVCTGNNGALMAKARKKEAKIHSRGPAPCPARVSTRNSREEPLTSELAVTASPITPASMTSPPNNEYRTNLIAARCLPSPP